MEAGRASEGLVTGGAKTEAGERRKKGRGSAKRRMRFHIFPSLKVLKSRKKRGGKISHQLTFLKASAPSKFFFLFLLFSRFRDLGGKRAPLSFSLENLLPLPPSLLERAQVVMKKERGIFSCPTPSLRLSLSLSFSPESLPMSFRLHLSDFLFLQERREKKKSFPLSETENTFFSLSLPLPSFLILLSLFIVIHCFFRECFWGLLFFLGRREREKVSLGLLAFCLACSLRFSSSLLCFLSPESEE